MLHHFEGSSKSQVSHDVETEVTSPRCHVDLCSSGVREFFAKLLRVASHSTFISVKSFGKTIQSLSSRTPSRSNCTFIIESSIPNSPTSSVEILISCRIQSDQRFKNVVPTRFGASRSCSENCLQGVWSEYGHFIWSW